MLFVSLAHTQSDKTAAVDALNKKQSLEMNLKSQQCEVNLWRVMSGVNDLWSDAFGWFLLFTARVYESRMLIHDLPIKYIVAFYKILSSLSISFPRLDIDSYTIPEIFVK